MLPDQWLWGALTASHGTATTPPWHHNLGRLTGYRGERLNAGLLLVHLGNLPAASKVLANHSGLDLGKPVRALSKGNKQNLALVQAHHARARAAASG